MSDIKAKASADAIFDKLYQAAPKIEWHVSPAAVFMARCATEFAVCYTMIDLDNESVPILGVLRGLPVFQDDALLGKTIELRSGNDVLSAITLE